MKTTFMALCLLSCSAAQAAETLPMPASPPVVQMPRLVCNPVGHPQAVCFWFDPTAQNCFPDVLSANPIGYPAIYSFNAGQPICWPGYQGLISVIKRAGG
jgi:hypothetical protein